MIFKEESFTRLDDFDSRGELTPTALLKVMENTSKHHSDSVEDDEILREMRGLNWLLTEWRVEILRTPVKGERLFTETWTLDCTGSVRQRRELRLSDGKGEALAKAEATFALYNMQENRVVRFDSGMMDKYKPEKEELFTDKLPRLTLPQSFSAEMPMAVRRTDLDFNRHVHNTAYLGYALELVPEELARTDAISAFRVVYHRSVKYGDEVTLRGGEYGGAWRVGIFADGELCCVTEVSKR